MRATSQFKNFAKATLDGGISSTDTSIALVTGHGSNLSDTADGSYRVTVWNDTDYPGAPDNDPNREVLLVNTRVTDDLTSITRDAAQDHNTVGKTYKLMQTVVEADMDDIDRALMNAARGEESVLSPDYDVTGNGSTDDQAEIASAETVAAAAGKTLVFPGGGHTFRFSTNQTFDCPVDFRPGSTVSIDTGVTLTFNDRVILGDWQTFSGLGDVTFTVAQTVQPESWGATRDGVDCSTAFAKCLDDVSSGQTIKLSTGTYNLATWATGGVNVAKDVAIVGDGEKSILEGVITADFLDVSNNVSVTGVHFKDWLSAFDLDSVVTAIDHFELLRCSSEGCGILVDWENPNASGSIDEIVIKDGRFIDFSDRCINVQGAFNTALAENNYIKEAKEQAIRFGNDDATYEDTWANTRIVNNTIKDLTRNTSSGTGASSYGILCYGYNVVIVGNTIDGVESHTGSGSESTGIYTKGRYSTITANTIANVTLYAVVNGVTTAHAFGIEVKGSDRPDTPSAGKPGGYMVSVVGNSVSFPSAGPGRARGIRAANQEILITGNTVENADDHGIHLGADGLVTSSLVCTSNIINMIASLSNDDCHGIRSNTLADMLMICNNVITGPCDFGIRINPDDGSCRSLHVNENMLNITAAAGFGIYFNPSSGAQIDLCRVEGNSIIGTYDEGISTRGGNGTDDAYIDMYVYRNTMFGYTDQYHFNEMPRNLYLDTFPPTGGTGTVASGATTAVITHGFPVAPRAEDIVIRPTNVPTNNVGSISVDPTTITSSQFTVTCLDPGTNTLTFNWTIKG